MGRAGGAGVRIDGSQVGDERSTRERVLDVALDIFIEQGYDKASLREIAERMGFTKAALYYHFPSKADMLPALHERMHSIIDKPVSLLGNGIVTVAMWEEFLDSCISALQGNQTLFQIHRINQVALAGVHSEGHEGEHQELAEQAMRIFSEPSLSPEDRLRMAAAFAVSFFTPFITSGLFANKGDEFLPTGLREIVHRALEPEAAIREAETEAAAAKLEAENQAREAKRETETETATATETETETATATASDGSKLSGRARPVNDEQDVAHELDVDPGPGRESVALAGWQDRGHLHAVGERRHHAHRGPQERGARDHSQPVDGWTDADALGPDQDVDLAPDRRFNSASSGDG
jgi:AcrR family transcriptional regulator